MSNKRKPKWVKEEHYDGEFPAWWRDDLAYGVIVTEVTRTVSEPLGPDIEEATGAWVYSPVYASDGLPAGDSNEYEEYTSLAEAQARCEKLAERDR